MKDYRDMAIGLIEKGYSVIPVDSLKQPTINWTKYQEKPMSEQEANMYFKNCHAIGILTGGPSRIELIDFDLKYDLSGDLYDRVKEALPTSLLEKMWVQSTKNNGFHWAYKTNAIEPNQKLASRHTTVYEKHKTYVDAFNNPSTREKAWKIIGNDKSRVLIETRGGENRNGKLISKGYFLLTPSPGYTHVYGDKMNEITDEERNLIISTCRQFNDFFVENKNYKTAKVYKEEGNPFQHFNESGDVLSILLDNGWEEVSGSGKNSVRLRRPGSPDSKSSALLDVESRIFNVFSTSTDFEVGKGYTATDVYIELECGGDSQLAYRNLKEMGY